MTIWARRWNAEENPAEAIILTEAVSSRPEFFVYPYAPAQAWAVAAEIVASPVMWATYNEGRLTGAVALTRILWPNDALLHFLFLDRNLAGKRKLLNGILGVCFEDFGLHRLSMEVPEGIRLERFARSVLRFRYEGEIRPRNPELPASLTDSWVAKQGSRIESGYFNGTGWSDILRLRLLASEWVGGERGPECQSEQSSGLRPPSSAG